MPKGRHEDTRISLHPLSFADAIKKLVRVPKRPRDAGSGAPDTTSADPGSAHQTLEEIRVHRMALSRISEAWSGTGRCRGSASLWEPSLHERLYNGQCPVIERARNGEVNHARSVPTACAPG